MKKTLIIALCCISVIFAACNKEKPNEKFIGAYQGQGTISGMISMTVLGQLFQEEIPSETMPMSINIAAGQTDNEVVLTYHNDDPDMNLVFTGTVTDNKVTFNPLTVSQTVDGGSITGTIDMAGTLNEAEGKLQIDGTFDANGTIADGGFNQPYSLNGTITANLTKASTATE